ncbi:MAG: hypothetical protein QMD22_00210 [archaeon]|nr:hypothetical protein [archaeon]
MSKGEMKGVMKMQNKPLWKIVAISLMLLMVVSCVAPSIAVDNHSTTENVYGDRATFISGYKVILIEGA